MCHEAIEKPIKNNNSLVPSLHSLETPIREETPCWEPIKEQCEPIEKPRSRAKRPKAETIQRAFNIYRTSRKKGNVGDSAHMEIWAPLAGCRETLHHSFLPAPSDLAIQENKWASSGKKNPNESAPRYRFLYSFFLLLLRSGLDPTIPLTRLDFGTPHRGKNFLSG